MARLDDPFLTDDGLHPGMAGLGATASPRGAAMTSTGDRSRSLDDEQPSLDETIAGDEPPLREPALGLDPGAVIGRHLVLQRLGAGGMGVVYAAYDPELDRRVALKLLRPGTAGPIARTRLLREAQALAKLSHPNVVAIHDVGTMNEQVWLAMEFVQGRTLSAWLGTPRQWQEVLAVMRSAGEGLAAAHAAGLLHRDFKPDNVMVGDDGRVRVMDFGLARVQVDAAPLDTEELRALPLHGATMHATRVGTIVGTPGYMAPEQFGRGELGAAADQFAFCVTLWEALYGERPFEGSTWMEMSDNVLGGRRRTPSQRRAVPGWLRRACERGLAVDPEQRWPSMAALLETLATGHARARSRRWLLAVGVLVLLGVGAEGWRRWELARTAAACEASGAEIEAAWSPARRERLRDAWMATGAGHAETTASKTIPWLDRQAEAWRQARVEACLDADVRGHWDADTLDRSLWCLDERRMELESLVDELTLVDANVLGKAVSAASALASVDPCRDERALEVLAPPPSTDREAIQAVRMDVARVANLELAGRYDQGLELARDALARAEALQWPPLTAAARLNLGAALEAKAAYVEAEVELTNAYFAAAEGLAPEVASSAATGLVLVVGARSQRLAEGKLWGRLAALSLASLRDDDGLRRAGLLGNLATIHESAGEYPEAERLERQALAIRERILGPDHPQVAMSLRNLAAYLAGAGQHDEALPLGERALAIYEQAFGPDHPQVAIGLLGLVRIHGAVADHARSKPLLERALVILDESLGPDHPHVGVTLNNLGLAYQALGDHERAEQLQLRAIAVFEKALGSDHPNVGTTVSHLANIYMARGDYERAAQLYERSLAIFEKAFGPDHIDVARSLGYLANAQASAGNETRAIPLLERALAIFEKSLGPDHPDVATTLDYLATALAATGSHDRALLLLERALAIYERALGPEHLNVMSPLLSLVEVALVEGRPTDALPLARRAVSVAEKADAPPLRLARARWFLARALWDAPVDQGGDRVQAMALAKTARDELGGSDEAFVEQRAKVEAWLREHEG